MRRSLIAIGLMLAPVAAWAQVAPTAAPDQLALLRSPDKKLAANKKLVFDFWRIVLEGRHLEKANDYLDPIYIQHNPTVPTGRDGFIERFSKAGPPQDYGPLVRAQLIDVMAEGDLVTLSMVRSYDDPTQAGQKYSTTWFDMFRVVNGKIVEHWDGARK